jgi:hypothetical protein
MEIIGTVGRNRRHAAKGLALAFVLALAGAAHAQLSFTDLGLTSPTPGTNDISQLLTTGDTAGYDSSGINYYDNNSGSSSPGASGQTFTMGNNAAGYVLTNLAIKYGGHSYGGNGIGSANQGWHIKVFQLSGTGNTNASVIYSNVTATTCEYTPGDWVQFSGMAVALQPNTTYAYTIVVTQSRSTSYDDLGYATGIPYTGGAVCRVQGTGGPVTYYPSDSISGTFDIGLTLFGPPVASTPSVSPSGPIFDTNSITLTESAVGTNPLFYQWQTDGGTGILSNILNATSASVTLTPPRSGSIRFDVIVTNSKGSTTSPVEVVTVQPLPGTADVSVYISKPMAAMPPLGLGVCSAVYDNDLISSSVATMLKAAGISAVRSPGGSYADVYDWQNNSGIDGAYVNSSDSFLNLMETDVLPAGANAVVTVNYGSNPANNAGGDTNIAADWVQYANVTHNWGVQYWEIGNEIYGNGFYSTNNDWEYDLHYPETSAANRVRQPALSPIAYGSNAVSFIGAMKAQDAGIKCGVFIQQPGAYPDTDATNPWNLNVLTNCASVIDFVILHYYPSGGPATLLAQPATIPSMVQSAYSEMSNEIGAAITSKLQLAITETGAGTNTGVVVSLWTADNYLSWIENGAFNVDYQILHTDILLNNQTPGHAYYGAQMAHFLASVGDTFLTSTSDQGVLRVHATSRQDGRVGVMLINTSPTLTNTVNVSIVGTNLAATGTQYQFGLTNFIGASDLPSYPVTTNTVFGLGNQFTVSVPPYSMIDLLIPVASNTPPVLAAISNQTVNVGQTVSFTASATDTNQPPQTLTFNLVAGPGNATLNTNTGAFSWRPLVSQADTTNAFTLMVADNGSPSLGATQNFTVTVNPLTQPGLSAVGLSNRLIEFQVSGEMGPDYAVQVSTNLADWSTLFITNSPAMPFSWMDTNAATLPARFYRLKAGPPLP